MARDLLEIVLEALDGDDPNVVRAACIMSGMLRSEKAERGLLKALGHRVWQVQAEAARSLGLCGSKGALPFLKRILKASDSDLRQKLLTAAAGPKKDAEPEKDEAHPEVKKAAALAMSRLSPALAEDALLAALASEQPGLLEAAMAGLATLQSETGAERIVQLLFHDNSKIRAMAATSLGRLRATAAVPQLLDVLNDADSAVRKEAVIALNHIKAKEAIEPLSMMMNDGDSEVRRVTAIALGNTRRRDPMVVTPLVKGLNDRSPDVRRAALSALANIRAATALENAAELLSDKHDEVKRQAAVTVSVLAMARERPDYDD
ncbi:MAG: HEAT repeat domain-containing protein [Deltaproteobacteria bacterium]|nr:HEAT repeat domain-containing protein [Deltaproteobacteria bacterium]